MDTENMNIVASTAYIDINEAMLLGWNHINKNDMSFNANECWLIFNRRSEDMISKKIPTHDEQVEVWENGLYIINCFLELDRRLGQGDIGNIIPYVEDVDGDNGESRFNSNDYDDVVNLCLDCEINPYDLYALLKYAFVDCNHINFQSLIKEMNES